MSRGATLSVFGLYNYNNRLFEKMVFPDGFTDDQKETVIGNILAETAGLECIFPDWNVMYKMIELWSKYNMPAWNRIYKTSLLEYNPIENYNRNELETIDDSKTDKHNNSDRNQASGSDSMNNSQTHFGADTETNKQTAYDSEVPHIHDTSELKYGHTIADSGSTNYGRTDTRTQIEENTHTGKITRNNHTSGNIGVTTSQQMITSEIELAALVNIIPYICDSFKERFCILVY